MIRSASELTGNECRVGSANKVQLKQIVDSLNQPEYAQLLVVFTLSLSSGRNLDLAFIHYFQTPGANAWLLDHGSLEARPTSVVEHGERTFLKRARIVAPAFITPTQAKYGVVFMSDIARLASFAPRYIGDSNVPESWYIYDIIQPLQEDLDLIDRVAEHFEGLMV